MKRIHHLLLLLALSATAVQAQNRVVKDSVVWRITYRDTVIYRYDTLRVRHYVFTDTVRAGAPALNTVTLNSTSKAKHKLSALNWGIGPSVGTYYSPYHGFDLNVGFGIQYYFFSIPSFRNPHMGHRKGK